MSEHRNKPARRRSVPGRPGIYVRSDARGNERFEYCFRDSQRKLVWKVVPGGVMSAVKTRNDVIARMSRGEQVVVSRVTFGELSARSLDQRLNLRPRTIASYRRVLRLHLIPTLGRLRVSDITSDDVGGLAAELERKGLSGSTIRTALVVAGQVLDYAVRRGISSSNPFRRLERSERPQVSRPEVRVLDRNEIDRLLQAADERHRAPFAVAVLTGLRIAELTGLKWGDVDFDAGVIRVRRQVTPTGEIAPLKTTNAHRDIILIPALAGLLRKHRIRSDHSQDADFIFTRARGGRSMQPDTLRSYLSLAADKAGINTPGRPRLRFHDLRHTNASLLIAEGLNPGFVSRQLGHASVSTTLGIYTHEFDRAQHAASVIERLEHGFGETLRRAQET